MAEVAVQLPTLLAALATDSRLDLHDGHFHEVKVNREARTMVMVVDCGNLDVGYRRLTLRFQGAAIAPDNLLLLADAVGAEFRPNDWHREPTVTEIRWVEVDLMPDRRFVLRLRLWPFYQFAIEFNALSIGEEPLEGRGPNHAGRFVVEHDAATTA